MYFEITYVFVYIYANSFRAKAFKVVAMETHLGVGKITKQFVVRDTLPAHCLITIVNEGGGYP